MRCARLSTVLIVAGVAARSPTPGSRSCWQEPSRALLRAPQPGPARRATSQRLEPRRPTRLRASRALRASAHRRERIAYPGARALRRRTPTGDAIGRIEIPRIGTSATSSCRAPTPQTCARARALPDDRRCRAGPTAAIAGHRTTYLAPFRDIDQLKRGRSGSRSRCPTRRSRYRGRAARGSSSRRASGSSAHGPRPARPVGLPPALQRRAADRRLRPPGRRPPDRRPTLVRACSSGRRRRPMHGQTARRRRHWTRRRATPRRDPPGPSDMRLQDLKARVATRRSTSSTPAPSPRRCSAPPTRAAIARAARRARPPDHPTPRARTRPRGPALRLPVERRARPARRRRGRPRSRRRGGGAPRRQARAQLEVLAAGRRELRAGRRAAPRRPRRPARAAAPRGRRRCRTPLRARQVARRRWRARRRGRSARARRPRASARPSASRGSGRRWRRDAARRARSARPSSTAQPGRRRRRARR